jgi:hypothetical protein
MLSHRGRRKEVIDMEKTQQNGSPGQGPEKEFRAGLVKAAVWKNTRKDKAGQEFEAVSVRVERRYQDKDGKWQSTSSFRPNDLPRLALVAQKAFEYVATAPEGAEGAEE